MILPHIYLVLFPLIGYPIYENQHDPLDIKVSQQQYYVRNQSGNSYKLMCVTEYKITNTSEEVYYSWLDYEKPKYSERNLAIRRYFFKAKGDFSFFNLMTDNVIFLNDDLYVGNDFVIEIQPKTTFRYIVAKDTPEDCQLECYIESAPKEWIEQQLLQIPIPDRFKYTQPYIVLR